MFNATFEILTAVLLKAEEVLSVTHYCWDCSPSDIASHARRHDSCHAKCALVPVCRYAWPVFTVSGYL